MHRVGGPLPFNSGLADITVAAVTTVITVILKTYFIDLYNGALYIIPFIDKEEKQYNSKHVQNTKFNDR